MAKYAMIGKAKPIPQNSRSTVCDAFDCLQDDLVTSQVVFDECTTYVDAGWPLFYLGAAGQVIDFRKAESDLKRT